MLVSRFGRPVPNVETTVTRPNPVGDVTKWRVDTSALSLRHTKQAIGLPDTGPPSHTFCVRGRADFLKVGQAPSVYRYTLFLTTNPYDFWIAKFREKCPRKARSDRASRNLRRSAWRVTGGGSVGSLPWVSERGCREFQPARVQAASRGCRIAYIAREPQFPPFPTQMSPRGSRGALAARRW